MNTKLNRSGTRNALTLFPLRDQNFPYSTALLFPKFRCFTIIANRKSFCSVVDCDNKEHEFINKNTRQLYLFYLCN